MYLYLILLKIRRDTKIKFVLVEDYKKPPVDIKDKQENQEKEETTEK